MQVICKHANHECFTNFTPIALIEKGTLPFSCSSSNSLTVVPDTRQIKLFETGFEL
jgi:hypothetical protein